MEHHGPHSWLEMLPLLPHDSKYLHVNGAVVVLLFVLVIAIIANRRVKNRIGDFIVPKPKLSLTSIIDLLVESLYKMVISIVGEHGKHYFPFIGSIFIFVLLCNLMGLLPLGHAPSSNINTTLALGIASFFYYNAMAVKEHGPWGYVKHFFMGLGPFLGAFVAFFELISHAIRPFSLALRLLVNMQADHAMVGAFSAIVRFALPVPLLLFGIVVSIIQAFVFASLTAVYVQMATEHDH